MTKEFGEILRRSRINLGLPREEVASAFSVAVQTVARWESGTVAPHPTIQASVKDWLREKARINFVPVDGVEFSIKEGDVRRAEGDVLVLKYAQARFGADLLVARELQEIGTRSSSISPEPGKAVLVETKGQLGTPKVMILGVKALNLFGYREIQKFGFDALRAVNELSPTAQQVVMTLHGAGNGLDEFECAGMLIAGCVQALKKGYCRRLKYLTWVEIDSERAQRLTSFLDGELEKLTKVRFTDRPGAWLLYGWNKSRADAALQVATTEDGQIRLADLESAKPEVPAGKPSAFVAMPFDKTFEDTYYYGIQRAVHATGLLSERIDQGSFTGDILDQIKSRIKAARVVIADLSTANANVYLEVGYAWGAGRETILLARSTDDLKFDVRGQRCILYASIRDLEERLTAELRNLVSKAT